VGIIIVACGPPGPHGGGGHTLQRSPLLNQLLHALRHVLHPLWQAMVTMTAATNNNFFFMGPSPIHLSRVASRQL